MSSPGKRFVSLDSIRGISALTVLLGHTIAVFSWDTSYSKLPLVHNLFDGRSAVTMFFVLSGFVLSFKPTARNQTTSLPSFYAKRLSRIWVPWFAVFVASIAAKEWLFRIPELKSVPLTEHHLSFWSSTNTWADIAKQLGYLLHDSTKLYLPQDWSLGVELRASILMPFFVFAARRMFWLLAIPAIAAPLVKPDTGFYYTSFVLGVVVAKIAVAQKFNVRPLYLTLAGFLLYQARWVSEATGIAGQTTECGVWIASSIGCALIILGVIRSRSQTMILETKPFQFLGKISYSLYLIQVLILVCVAPWIAKSFESVGIHSHAGLQILIVASVVAVCLPLSWLCERFVEQPSIRLGSNLSQHLEKLPILTKIRI